MGQTKSIYTSDPVALHSVTVKDSSRYGRGGSTVV